MFHSFLRIWGVLCARNQGIVTVRVSNSGPYGTDRWHIRASPAGVGSALPGPLAQTATTRGWFFSVAEVLVLEASGSSSHAISSALLPSILSTPSDNGFPELIGGKVQQMLWETGGLPRPQAMPQNGGTLGIPQVPGVLAHNCILQNLPSPQPLPAAWLLDDSAIWWGARTRPPCLPLGQFRRAIPAPEFPTDQTKSSRQLLYCPVPPSIHSHFHHPLTGAVSESTAH